MCNRIRWSVSLAAGGQENIDLDLLHLEVDIAHGRASGSFRGHWGARTSREVRGKQK